MEKTHSPIQTGCKWPHSDTQIRLLRASQGVPVVKNPPASAGDVRGAGSIPGLGRLPEKGMATHSSVLAWEIHGKRSLVGYRPWGCKEPDTT